jgi:hypothetical protein
VSALSLSFSFRFTPFRSSQNLLSLSLSLSLPTQRLTRRLLRRRGAPDGHRRWQLDGTGAASPRSDASTWVVGSRHSKCADLGFRIRFTGHRPRHHHQALTSHRSASLSSTTSPPSLRFVTPYPSRSRSDLLQVCLAAIHKVAGPSSLSTSVRSQMCAFVFNIHLQHS